MRRIAAISRLLGHFVLALGIFTVAMMSTGCEDRWYHFIYENHTDAPLDFVPWPGVVKKVGPCSVIGGTTGGPYVEDVEKNMVVRDMAGNRVDRIQITRAEAQGNTPDLLVQALPEVLGVCPTPLEGQYMLRLKSYVRERVEVWQDQQLLVSLNATSEQLIGPIEGDWDWQLPRDLEVRDSEGKVGRFVVSGPSVDYTLGDVPTVVCSILQNSIPN